MRLKSNLVRNTLILGSALFLAGCASQAESVPVSVALPDKETPTSTFTATPIFSPTPTPNATAWALTTPENYATAINATSYAVETEMPEEIRGEIEDSQYIANFDFESIYRSNGIENETQTIFSSGITIFKPINVNNESYVPILLSGHQVSEEGVGQLMSEDLRNNNIAIDSEDGKEQITTSLIDIAIEGEVFTSDMFAVRSEFKNTAGVDWAIILIKENDFKNKDLLKKGFDSNKIFWGTPPNDARYFAVSKTKITEGRSVVAVDAINHGKYFDTQYDSIGLYYVVERSSGSGIFVEIDGVKYYFGAVSGTKRSVPNYVGKANTTPIGEVMTKEKFDEMLQEMAKELNP